METKVTHISNNMVVAVYSIVQQQPPTPPKQNLAGDQTVLLYHDKRRLYHDTLKILIGA